MYHLIIDRTGEDIECDFNGFVRLKSDFEKVGVGFHLG